MLLKKCFHAALVATLSLELINECYVTTAQHSFCRVRFGVQIAAHTEKVLNNPAYSDSQTQMNKCVKYCCL